MGLDEVIGPLVAPALIRKGLRERFRGHGPDESFVARRIAVWDTPKVRNAIAFEVGGMAAGLAEVSPKYPYITRPVFVLAQRGEAYHGWVAERMHDDIPGSSIRLVSRTGHFIQDERPDAVVLAIRQAAAKAGLGLPVEAPAEDDDDAPALQAEPAR
jgi:pimeloyl-ACP methyl ester carboxylesterase